jgi:hypothetical protein
VLEDRQAAVVLQVLVWTNAVSGLPQDAGEGRLSHLDRFSPHIDAVQL